MPKAGKVKALPRKLVDPEFYSGEVFEFEPVYMSFDGVNVEGKKVAFSVNSLEVRGEFFQNASLERGVLGNPVILASAPGLNERYPVLDGMTTERILQLSADLPDEEPKVLAGNVYQMTFYDVESKRNLVVEAEAAGKWKLYSRRRWSVHENFVAEFWLFWLPEEEEFLLFTKRESFSLLKRVGGSGLKKTDYKEMFLEKAESEWLYDMLVPHRIWFSIVDEEIVLK